jgi:hypothetical protein
MIVLVMLSLAIMAAFGVKTIVGERYGRGLAVAAAASTFVLIENFAAPLKPARLAVPDFFRTLAADDADYAILDIPTDEDMRPISMYFQIAHQKPILGGQVPRRSPGADALFEQDEFLQAVKTGELTKYYLNTAIQPETRSSLESTRLGLRKHGVRYIVLHTWHMSPRDEEIARKLLPLLGGAVVQQIPYLSGKIIVYELAREQF